MTSKTTNKFSPEVRTRAVRMVLEHEGEHASRWAAVVSISSKIGCTPQSLHEWVKKAEIDSGKRSGVPSDVSDRLKAVCTEKSNARVVMVKSAQDGVRTDETGSLNRPKSGVSLFRDRCVLTPL